MKAVLIFLWALIALVVGLGGFLIYMLLTSPSCYERGGVQVYKGSTVQMIMVGKVMIPQTVPMYSCEIAP